MTRAEQKKWLQYFRDNTDRLSAQLQWVAEPGISLKVLANRVGIMGSQSEVVLRFLMPTGLRDAIIKKYPGRMVR